MRQILPKIVLNTILGVVLIIIWSRFVNLGDVLAKVFSASPSVIFPFLLFFVASAGFKALRLQKILNIPNLAWKDLWLLNFLSQFLSLLIPIRAGEIAKSVYLSHQFKVPFAKTLTWIFIDRFMDFLTFVMIVVVFINFVPTNLPADFFKVISLIFIVLMVLLTMAVKKSHNLKKLIKLVSGVLIFPSLKQKFVNFSVTIIEGFEVLDRHPKELALFIFLSFLAATSDGFLMLVCFRQFMPDFSLSQGILGNALNAFTYLMPSAPGFIGSAEAAGLAVFGGVLGINADVASAGTVFAHILTLIVLAILGTASLYFLKFDLNLVWRKIKGKGK